MADWSVLKGIATETLANIYATLRGRDIDAVTMFNVVGTNMVYGSLRLDRSTTPPAILEWTAGDPDDSDPMKQVDHWVDLEVGGTKDASDLESGTLSSDRLPVVPVSKGGTGASSQSGALANLGGNDAGNLSEGTILQDRLPVINLTKIPSLPASRVTTEQFDAARLPGVLEDLGTVSTPNPSDDENYVVKVTSTGVVSLEKLPFSILYWEESVSYEVTDYASVSSVSGLSGRRLRRRFRLPGAGTYRIFTYVGNPTSSVGFIDLRYWRPEKGESSPSGAGNLPGTATRIANGILGFNVNNSLINMWDYVLTDDDITEDSDRDIVIEMNLRSGPISVGATTGSATNPPSFIAIMEYNGADVDLLDRIDVNYANEGGVDFTP